MKHIIYDTSHKTCADRRNISSDMFIKYYYKHYKNVILLERLRTLHDDFDWTQRCELEIAIGQRKCDYWYKRLDFLPPDFFRKCAQIKASVYSTKIG